MTLSGFDLKKPLLFGHLFFILCWVSRLAGTDSFYSVYGLCCILSVICLVDNYRSERKMKGISLVLGLTLSCLLSLASTLANYPLFQYIRNDVSPSTNLILNGIAVISAFAGGILVFYHIFMYAADRFPVVCDSGNQQLSRNHPGRVFAATMASLSAIYLIYLFFVSYPGNVTSDAWWQIDQTRTGDYSVHHPFWHTMCIKVCMTLGYAVFQNVNAMVCRLCRPQPALPTQSPPSISTGSPEDLSLRYMPCSRSCRTILHTVRPCGKMSPLV